MNIKKKDKIVNKVQKKLKKSVNDVCLFTFPAHTSHLLQPLDVGVYRSLKSLWGKELNRYMVKNPLEKPNRYNFYEIFNTPFLEAFSRINIINAFKKSGVCPYDMNVVSPEALAPSRLTDKEPTEQRSRPISPAVTSSPSVPNASPVVEDLLKTPDPTRTKPARKRNVDSSAKCLTPPSELDLQEASTSSSRSQRSISKKCRQIQDDAVQHNDDWVCGVCQGRYSDDKKKKTGAKWIECCFCATRYHEKCQIGPFEDVYMCDKCDKYNENSYSD